MSDSAAPYHIDLERFSLERFRQILETGRLLPSEQVLREELADRFAVLASMGIRTLADLIAAKERTGVYRAAIPGSEDLVSWLETVRELSQPIEW